MYSSFADELNGIVGFAGTDDRIIRIFQVKNNLEHALIIKFINKYVF